MSFLAAVQAWLFGADGVNAVSTAVDKAFYTEQEKAGDDAEDLKSARAFAGVSNHPGIVNQLVDAASRLIRPGVTLWMIGGFVGWWPLPELGSLDPYWQSVFTLVLTFWFGGRALLKDLPVAIRAMRAK